MSLDGLRAWIGEVERKLGMRTRVFLVLAVIAVGGAGAAIYLAVEAKNDSVSEGDVQALQQELEARIGTGGAGGSATALEAEIDALRAEVEALKGEGDASGGTGDGSGSAGKGGSGNSGSHGDNAGVGGASTESVPLPPSASGGKSATKLNELLQKAKEEQEAAEKAGGK